MSGNIGLKRGTVTLSPYSEEWSKAAETAITQLRHIIGDDAADIQHVGSTSIRGIHAKPIIDIAVGMQGDAGAVLNHNEALAAAGVVYRREERPGEFLYVMGDVDDDFITHHIHVITYDGTVWRNYIRFRDRLNADTALAAEYDELKQGLSQAHAAERAAYTAGKAEFIAKVLLT